MEILESASVRSRLRSRAAVTYFLGERQAARRAATRLFGRRLKRWELAALCGAPPDALVEVGTLAGDLYLDVRSRPSGFYRIVLVVRRTREGLRLVNDGFCVYRRLPRYRRLAQGVLRRQRRAAARLGIASIETHLGDFAQ
jgi:hypothetical protein